MLEYSHIELKNADLKGRDLRGYSFDGSTISNVDMTNADLRGASFINASVKDLHLTMCCKTFEDVTVDAKLFRLLMFMIAKLKVLGEVPIEVRIQLVDALMDPAVSYSQLVRLLIPAKEYFKLEELTLELE